MIEIAIGVIGEFRRSLGLNSLLGGMYHSNNQRVLQRDVWRPLTHPLAYMEVTDRPHYAVYALVQPEMEGGAGKCCRHPYVQVHAKELAATTRGVGITERRGS